MEKLKLEKGSESTDGVDMISRDMEKLKLEKGSESTDGVDMISNLPDPILHSILSRVPTTEDVTRTSILSKRWRYLWTSVPSIDICYSRGLNLKPLKELEKKKFEEFVCRALANESIDLDSFHLSCGGCYNMSTLGRWIEAAVRRKVKLLDLMCYRSLEHWYDDIELPHCLVACRSLEILKLRFCSCRLSLPKFTGFPALKVLEFNGVELYNQDLVKEFLKSCPLLEDLSLVNCLTRGLSLFCISCPKLMNLRIDNRKLNEDYPQWVSSIMCNRLHICCPNLVFLEYGGYIANEFTFERLNSLKKVVVHRGETFALGGNKIWEMLAEISHAESLSLSICSIEENIDLQNLPESLPNLKTLELITNLSVYNMDVLIQMLTSSPKLECLHIMIEEDFLTEAPNLDYLEMECTYEQLKMVKVTGIISAIIPHLMGFLWFMLKSSPVLKTMSMTPSVNTTDDKLSILTAVQWKMSMTPSVNMTDEKLSFLTAVQRFPRASPEAQIIIV